MVLFAALLAALAHADPEPVTTATTADGKTAVLRDDGTWTLVDAPSGEPAPPPAAPAAVELGAFTVDLGRTATGQVFGGATTPNRDGPGYLAVTCDGPAAVALIVHGPTPLSGIDPAAALAAEGRGAIEVPFRRGARRLGRPAALGDGTVVTVVEARALMKALARDPRDELLAVASGRVPGGMAETARFSLDGFRAAWARVEAACSEGSARAARSGVGGAARPGTGRILGPRDRFRSETGRILGAGDRFRSETGRILGRCG